jgi:hypothetical protein
MGHPEDACQWPFEANLGTLRARTKNFRARGPPPARQLAPLGVHRTMPENFSPAPEAHPGLPRPATGRHPRGGRKMSRQAKKAQNEKWKALLAQATHELDLTVSVAMQGQPQPDVMAHLVKMQMILVELLETLVEREAPG